MEIILADAYGYCFGVKRAVEGVWRAAQDGARVATLGPVIHNKTVIREMEAAGIRIVNEVAEIGDDVDMVVIRAHGVPPQVYQALWDKNLDYMDLTCPCVKANQKLAKSKHDEGKVVIIAGDGQHPEIVGINGWLDAHAIVVQDVAAAGEIVHDDAKEYFLMAQTTFCVRGFEEIAAKLGDAMKNLEVSNTICADTRKMQEAAEKLAGQVDKMVVIGDVDSSNSRKLYEISRAIQPNTYFIENPSDLELKNFAIDDRIGITAGASTPPATTIEEAVKQMSEFEKSLEQELENERGAVDTTPEPVKDEAEGENTAPAGENFEEMLEESITSLHTGQVVKGKVISVVNGEVMVDLQYKSDGIIQKGQFSDKADVDPAEIVKPGDEIEVFVLRVNDGDGNVLLSKKRIDAQKGYTDIEHAFMHDEPIKGKVVEIVKGGVIANIAGVRAFVPSTQVAERFVKDLASVLHQEFNFSILELDKGKRPWRIIAGRRALAAKEAQEKKDAAMAKLVEGEKVTGKVSSIAGFGAFIDLGGIDGLIHVSELSWGRVRNVADVLKEGDTVEAYVIKLDKSKGKVSLSLKDISNDPWNGIDERYPVGSIVNGRVVRMVNFGAFVELEEGVDGLVHISQISHKHVNKPDEELTTGQIVQVKITEINIDNKKISLSIKEALDDYEDDDYYDDDYYDDDLEAASEEAEEATEVEAEPEAEAETEVETEAEAEPEEVEQESAEAAEAEETETESQQENT